VYSNGDLNEPMQDNNLKHVLLIEDNERFRRMLARFFNKVYPSVTIDQYNTENGRPPVNFDWDKYELLILDYNLSQNESGLDWLRKSKTGNHFPATILLTGHGNEEIAIKALRYGAYDYLRKKDLSIGKLNESIQRAMKHREEDQKKADTITLRSTIFNKARFYKKIEEADGSSMVMLLEIDDFHNIHKQHGIHVSDNLTSYISNEISGLFSDKFSALNITRIGDATITVLISDHDSTLDTEKHVDCLCKHFDKRPFISNSKQINYSLSIGVVVFNNTNEGAQSILAKVDAASRIAKNSQGNSAVFYSGLDKLDNQINAEVSLHLDKAIEEGRILPSFQPLIRVSDADSSIQSEMYQISVRLLGLDKQTFAAEEYIPVLNSKKMLHKLDRWVIRYAMGRLSLLRKQGNNNIGLIITLCEKSITDKNFCRWIDHIIQHYKQPDLGSSIVLEIRLDYFLAHQEEASALINRLRDHYGISFSLIDVPNIDLLKQANLKTAFEFIKVSTKLYDDNYGSNIAAIIQTAQSFGSMSISEKIENGDQLSLAVESKCDFVCGDFVQHPQEDIVMTESVIM
jgi:EAL domain-containing protein (putative c-di-GMP-specific phosphodiesterase class I)/FixJ family two-component response regulator